MGRPPLQEGDRRHVVGISMGGREIEALRELAELRGESQGIVGGRLVMKALERERRKSI